MNAATGQCLDSDGKTMYTLPCNGGKFQKWRKGDVSGRIVNFETKKCFKALEGGEVHPQRCNKGGRIAWLE